jgi:hypothetical protein
MNSINHYPTGRFHEVIGAIMVPHEFLPDEHEKCSVEACKLPESEHKKTLVILQKKVDSYELIKFLRRIRDMARDDGYDEYYLANENEYG